LNMSFGVRTVNVRRTSSPSVFAAFRATDWKSVVRDGGRTRTLRLDIQPAQAGERWMSLGAPAANHKTGVTGGLRSLGNLG
jgi:hypothetical protein